MLVSKNDGNMVKGFDKKSFVRNEERGVWLVVAVAIQWRSVKSGKREPATMAQGTIGEQSSDTVRSHLVKVP